MENASPDDKPVVLAELGKIGLLEAQQHLLAPFIEPHDLASGSDGARQYARAAQAFALAAVFSKLKPGSGADGRAG